MREGWLLPLWLQWQPDVPTSRDQTHYHYASGSRCNDMRRP